MQLTTIRSIQEFEALAADWNSLLEESAIHVPFLRHEYLIRWWKTLGGGEWNQAELAIVKAVDDSGALIGIAPLFATNNPAGEKALMLLGSIEISDFLDLLARPEDLNPFCQALFEHLAGLTNPPWQVIDLYNILDSSPTRPAIQAAAAALSWKVQEEPLQHSPFIPLPGDWETYLAGIDKKQRHEIRRKLRRLEETGDKIRWYIVEDKDNLPGEIESFLELMALDDEKRRFLTPAMRSQLEQTMSAAFDAGWLQLAFLEIEGLKAAAYLNFDYDNHIWVYNSGIDLDYGSYSPGWVLLAYLLKWANDHRRRVFDFMRGDEEYKYRFGGIDRRVVRLAIRR